MVDSLEKEISRTLIQNSEVPEVVRKSLDNTYDIIKKKQKSNDIWNKSMKRIAVAACGILIVGALAANGAVIAGVKTFFNDQGIVRIFEEGLFQTNYSYITDENISVSLDSYFYDSNKISLIMNVKFDDVNALKSIENVGLDFRLKNGNGEYIAEMIPDTKPLKGEVLPHVVNAAEMRNSIDINKGEVQFYIILESTKGAIPILSNAVLDVESVNLFDKSGQLTKIDGTWPLTINEIIDVTIPTIEYIAQNNSSDIEVLSAKASPSSFNINYALNGNYELLSMKLISEKGEEFEGRGFYLEEKNGKTFITTNFAVSSYDHVSKYILQVYKIGSFQNDGSIKYLLTDQAVDLVKK
ncbi:MAG: DUF4179 domain-containing protein [Bacillota bacterium]|nr:DUF4179 domain-containing protein [Bacillota bacterium]